MNKKSWIIVLMILIAFTMFISPILTVSAMSQEESKLGYLLLNEDHPNDFSSDDFVYDSSSSEPDDLTPLIVFIGIICLVVGYGILCAYATYKEKNAKQNSGEWNSIEYSEAELPIVLDNTVAISNKLMEFDPQFDAEKFENWAKEVISILYIARMEQDVNKVQLFETASLYYQHAKHIKALKKQHLIPVVEQIRFLQAYLHQYRLTKEYEYLSIFLEVELLEYTKNVYTDEILSGSKDEPCRKLALYTFRRNRGKLTNLDMTGYLTVCPQCGAPIPIQTSGCCEYCGFAISSDAVDWVLFQILQVAPGVKIDNIGIKYE